MLQQITFLQERGRTSDSTTFCRSAEAGSEAKWSLLPKIKLVSRHQNNKGRRTFAPPCSLKNTETTHSSPNLCHSTQLITPRTHSGKSHQTLQFHSCNTMHRQTELFKVKSAGYMTERHIHVHAHSAFASLGRNQRGVSTSCRKK